MAELLNRWGSEASVKLLKLLADEQGFSYILSAIASKPSTLNHPLIDWLASILRQDWAMLQAATAPVMVTYGMPQTLVMLHALEWDANSGWYGHIRERLSLAAHAATVVDRAKPDDRIVDYLMDDKKFEIPRYSMDPDPYRTVDARRAWALGEIRDPNAARWLLNRLREPYVTEAAGAALAAVLDGAGRAVDRECLIAIRELKGVPLKSKRFIREETKTVWDSDDWFDSGREVVVAITSEAEYDTSPLVEQASALLAETE